MNILEIVIELFVSGLGSVSDLTAHIGFKLVMGMLLVGAGILLWHFF